MGFLYSRVSLKLETWLNFCAEPLIAKPLLLHSTGFLGSPDYVTHSGKAEKFIK